jgi:Fur family ferric uptake transcriptional regulator
MIAELRRQGYRLTPQREMIVEAIARAGRHMTAEEVFDKVHARSQAVNIATVYRTLELLAELGMVSRCDLSSGKVTYASPWHGPHCHLVCRRCGAVTEADTGVLTPLTDQLRTRYGFAPDVSHFAIHGLCNACQEELERDDVA